MSHSAVPESTASYLSTTKVCVSAVIFSSTPTADILLVSKAYILSPFFFFLQLRRNWHSLYIKCCSLSCKMIFRIQSPRPSNSLAIGFWEIPHWEARQTEASETHHLRPCECPLEQIFWKHYPGEKKITALNNSSYSECRALLPVPPAFYFFSFHSVIAGIKTRLHWREQEGIWVREARHRFKCHQLRGESPNGGSIWRQWNR